ncbi:MAG: ABC transporter substrate-binding protein [Moraxellaceae bacterium]|nr:ABC transporter substrate-binding protein [Moraxellaceae bacterium]
MRKIASLLLNLAAVAAGLTAGAVFAQNNAPKLEVKEIRYQGWATQVTFPELAEDLGYLAPLKLNWVGNTISGPQDVQSVATGDIDIGGAFNGAILKLIAAKAPIKPVLGHYGIDEKNYHGFFVLNESPIKNARDLIGKKVGVNTLGAHIEFTLREYLSRNGLTPAEIKQVTLVALPPVNTEQALRQGQIDVAALFSVLRDKAVERGGIRTLFTDYELFGKFTAGTYVLNEKFIKANPNATRHLVTGVARAIDWAQTQPVEVVRARFEKIIVARKRNEDTSSLAYWKSTGIANKGGVVDDRELQIWIDWLVKDGLLKPGQLKASQAYTNAYNDYAKQSASVASAK